MLTGTGTLVGSPVAHTIDRTRLGSLPKRQSPDGLPRSLFTGDRTWRAIRWNTTERHASHVSYQHLPKSALSTL